MTAFTDEPKDYELFCENRGTITPIHPSLDTPLPLCIPMIMCTRRGCFNIVRRFEFHSFRNAIRNFFRYESGGLCYATSVKPENSNENEAKIESIRDIIGYCYLPPNHTSGNYDM